MHVKVIIVIGVYSLLKLLCHIIYKSLYIKFPVMFCSCKACLFAAPFTPPLHQTLHLYSTAVLLTQPILLHCNPGGGNSFPPALL